MKKFVKKALVATLALACLPLIQSCKKGEGDPFLSLRSRKARLTGEWTVQTWTEESSYSNTSSSGNTSSGTDKYELEDGDASMFTSYTSSGPYGDYTSSSSGNGDGEITITFNKDGTFSRVYEMNVTYSEDGTTYATTLKVESLGTWSFLHASGKEFENRERVSLNVTEEDYSTTETSDGYSQTYSSKSEYASGSYSETWLITTLKNKEISFEADYSGSGSYANTSTGLGSGSTETGTSKTQGGIKATMTRE